MLKFLGHHHHSTEKPCEVCPRHGKCVPKVQCPAHVRPNSYNPLCHIGGHDGLVGVCCFTGSSHAGIVLIRTLNFLDFGGSQERYLFKEL